MRSLARGPPTVGHKAPADVAALPGAVPTIVNSTGGLLHLKTDNGDLLTLATWLPRAPLRWAVDLGSIRQNRRGFYRSAGAISK
jgi:hypothetical protein